MDKIHSKRLYTEQSKSILKNYSSTSDCNPWWITGLTEGKGNFSIDITKTTKAKLGKRVQASFNITQRDYNRVILDKCQKYFLVGHVRTNNKSSGMMIYRIRDLQHLLTIVIPFFEKYPLQGVKHLDYQDWARVVRIMETGGHLTKDGLENIIDIKKWYE